MIKYRLIQLINPIFRIFGYGYQKSAWFDSETFEIIYGEWEFKKIKNERNS